MDDKAIIIIVVGVVAALSLFYIYNKPTVVSPSTLSTTTPQSPSSIYTTSPQSSSQLGNYRKVYFNQSTTFSPYTIAFKGTDPQSGKAILVVQAYGYSLNLLLGANQYMSLGFSNGPPYLSVTQIQSNSSNGNSNWVTIGVSNNVSIGFTLGTISGTGTGGPSTGSYNQSRSQSYIPINLGTCGVNSTYLSVPPISFSNFSSITPLGWVSPGGHVFPSDHIYFQLNSIGAQFSGITINTSVVAPGNVTIYTISNRSYGSSYNDYSVYFSTCNSVSMYFHHVHVLSSKLSSNLTVSGQTCGSGTINAGQIHSCNKIVNIKVKAGELIGYIGGVPFAQGGPSSLDFGVYDARAPTLIYANSSRYSPQQLHVACPINYYPQGMQSTLLAKIGLGDITRTQPPICGQNDYDVIGTAQGNWFPPNAPTPYINEGLLISLARSNLIPSVGLFSIGSSSNIPGLSGVTYYFDPSGIGLVNRNFSNVTANGNIYCYGLLRDRWTAGNSRPVSGIILLQLLNSNTLRIEYQNANSCGSSPWSFTSNHADFYR